MTKQDILDYFSDINQVYNDSSRLDSLSNMIDEMLETALEKDKCSSCKHYDKDYGETCLNPEGTCRVFEYDGYEEAENEHL